MNRLNFALTILLSSFALVLAQYPDTAITTNSFEQMEVTIAISPLNPNYLMATWNDYRIVPKWSEPGFAFSTDIGLNWDEDILPDSGQYVTGIDPSCAFDNLGNAFYCYLAYDTTTSQVPSRVLLARTTNFSSPFNWYVTSVSDTSLPFYDKPFMTVDNTDGEFDGRIYVTWRDYDILHSQYRIRFSFSQDSGKTFSPNITIDSTAGDNLAGAYFNPPSGLPSGYPSLVVQGAMPVVGPDGELYVVWFDVQGGGYNQSFFKIRKSTDGGETFNSIAIVDTFTVSIDLWGYIQAANIPCLAVDLESGYVYVWL